MKADETVSGIELKRGMSKIGLSVQAQIGHPILPINLALKEPGGINRRL